MADNYIITISYNLNSGNIGAEAAAAGRQAGDAFQSAFKPNIDLTRSVNVGAFGKQSAEALRSSLESARLDNVLSRPLQFFKRDIQSAVSGITAKPITVEHQLAPGKTPAHGAGVGHDFGEELLHKLHPFISGLEAFSLLMRGSPILSVLRATGYAASGVAGAFEGGEHGGGGTARRPGAPETNEERIARRLRGELPAAEGGAAEGAAAGGAFSLAQRLGGAALRLGAVGLAGGAVAEGIKVVGELGVKGAETAHKLENMAEGMGISTKQLLTMRAEFAHGGVNIDDFTRAINRLNLAAHRQMPAIEKEVEDSSNVVVESNIKVAESERAVEKSRDDREAATDKTTKSEAELVKVQTTGAEVISQQRKAAELGVSGAALGTRSAEDKERAAQLNLQFAPQESALEEVKGPLTVEGAKLSERGAELNAADAATKLRQLLTGEKPDPEIEKQRQIKKARLNLETARLNAEQAHARTEEADIAEQKRVQLPNAIDRAQQQADEAAQAKESADLHKRQTKTSLDRLKIDQSTNDLKTQEREAQRNVNESKRNEAKTSEEQITTRIDLERKEKEARIKQAEQIPALQEVIRGGKLPEGVDIREINSDQIKKALFKEGEGKAGPTIDALRSLLQNPAVIGEGEEKDTGKAKELVQDILPQRAAGPELDRLVRVLSKPKGQLAPDEQKDIDDLDKQLQGYIHSGLADKIVETEGTAQERAERERLRTGIAAGPQAEYSIKLRSDADTLLEQTKRGALGVLNTADNPGPALSAIGSGIKAGGAEVVSALKKVAGEIASAMGKSEPAGGAGINATEETNKAEGGTVTGRISGAGSGTSDNVPINASPDEFIIKAERTRQLGVNFLNALNDGRIGKAEGGHVSDEDDFKKSPEYMYWLNKRKKKNTFHESDDHRSVADIITERSGVNVKFMDEESAKHPVFGGYGNALQQRLAYMARKPDFDAKDKEAVQTYLARLRSGETPESIRADDAAEKERATSVTINNPFFQGEGELSGTGEKKKIDEDNFAKGGIIRSFFARGGPVIDEGEDYLKYAPEMINAYLSQKVNNGISVAGLSGEVSAHSINASAIGDTNARMGAYQLDLRTAAGTFSSTVSEDTMEGIRNSSLSGKLSQTGPTPSWYS